jgi:ribosomal protein S18 acetylase RimI-like enzyme
MQNISIRKTDLADLENLQKIGTKTFRETFSEVNTEEDMQKYLDENLSLEKLTSELKNPDSEFYFAEQEGDVLGYLKINFGNAQTENVKENTFEIERIYVLKEFHGLKVGQILFEKALSIGKERKMDSVWLGVWEENHRALRFYEKNGFEVFGKHDFVLGEDVQTDLMMKLKL